MSRLTPRPGGAVAAALTALALAVPAAASAAPAGSADTAPRASAAVTCEKGWGSLAKQRNFPGLTETAIQTVRAGQHACFDRLVVDIGRIAPSKASYDARYVTQVVNDFTGEPAPVDGGAVIELTLGTPMYDDRFRPVWNPADPVRAVDVRGFDVIKQVRLVSSWEGQTQLAVGTRARLPMRVTTVTGSDGHALVVIDVARSW